MQIKKLLLSLAVATSLITIAQASTYGPGDFIDVDSIETASSKLKKIFTEDAIKPKYTFNGTKGEEGYYVNGDIKDSILYQWGNDRIGYHGMFASAPLIGGYNPDPLILYALKATYNGKSFFVTIQRRQGSEQRFRPHYALHREKGLSSYYVTNITPQLHYYTSGDDETISGRVNTHTRGGQYVASPANLEMKGMSKGTELLKSYTPEVNMTVFHIVLDNLMADNFRDQLDSLSNKSFSDIMSLVREVLDSNAVPGVDAFFDDMRDATTEFTKINPVNHSIVVVSPTRTVDLDTIDKCEAALLRGAEDTLEAKTALLSALIGNGRTTKELALEAYENLQPELEMNNETKLRAAVNRYRQSLEDKDIKPTNRHIINLLNSLISNGRTSAFIAKTVYTKYADYIG